MRSGDIMVVIILKKWRFLEIHRILLAFLHISIAIISNHYQLPLITFWFNVDPSRYFNKPKVSDFDRAFNFLQKSNFMHYCIYIFIQSWIKENNPGALMLRMNPLSKSQTDKILTKTWVEPFPRPLFPRARLLRATIPARYSPALYFPALYSPGSIPPRSIPPARFLRALFPRALFPRLYSPALDSPALDSSAGPSQRDTPSFSIPELLYSRWTWPFGKLFHILYRCRFVPPV